ncbi:MAG: glycosyltransferase family 25 protein [Tropicimonas sp.]|uniref:glycosyltransferase family 25 protein n=1 Tax=Tropicimonas sp. TaxID=2067044 RepID=UPI003A873FAB
MPEVSSAVPGHWPIFVISLADAAVRRDNIRSRLDELGLQVSFMDAIDGRRGLPAEYESWIDRPKTLERRGYPMSDGEYACALSHQVLYRRVVDENLPGAIILEDDVTPTPLFRDFVQKRGYERADLIQLFFFDAKVFRFPKPALTDRIRMRRLTENAFMAAGYSISRRGATHLVKKCTPLSERADWPCDVTRIGAAVTQPRLVMHPDPAKSESSLNAGRANLVPEGFDYSARYAKGWHRLYRPRYWRSFVRNRLSERLAPGFDPD